MVILGFGTGTSFVFSFIAMIKIISNNNFHIYLSSSHYCQVLNYSNLNDEKKEAMEVKV